MPRHHNLLSRSPATGSISATRGSSAFALARTYIETDSKDVHILVVGDSTGNETTEWPYLFGQWLFAQYPSHSVDYRLYNDGANSYDAAISLGTGNGSRKITIWNASIGGSTPFYLIGSKRATAIDAVSPDLMIFNYGHNVVTAGGLTQIRSEMLQGTEAVREAHPSVPLAMFTQNPRRDDSDYANVNQAIREVVAGYGDVTLIDAYTPFINAGKPSAWYGDNIHPTGAGKTAFLDALTAQWRSGSFDLAQAFMAQDGANLLPNGDFAAFSGPVPDSWLAINSPTCTKELTIVDGSSPYSVKITGTTGQARIRAGATSIAGLVGGKASLAVRAYIPSGSASSVGRIGLSYVAGGTTIINTRATTDKQGGWHWIIVSGMDIPANATAVDATLYCDTSANASSAAYYDRAILVAGEFPRDMA